MVIRRMVRDELARDILYIKESDIRNLDRADSNWQKIWLSRKSFILSPHHLLIF